MNKKRDLAIIGGMRFKDINACTHRMIGIAKLFKPHCENVFLLGVGDQKENGIFDSFDYETTKYPSGSFAFFKFTFSAREYIKFLKSKKSLKYVVVNGSVPSIPTIKIARYCRKNDIKFIFDIGEWYSNSYHFIKGLIKGLDVKIKMKTICKKYNDYIVASTYLADHCGREKNVLILPTIVTSYLPNKSKSEKVYSGVINLSFIGMLEKRNLKEDLHPLIEAIAGFNNNHQTKFVLNVIGTDGDDQTYVKYFGRKKYTECINYLIDSDFSLIPRSKTRKNESGFPTKLSESFAYGVPVIATDTSDIKKYIIDGENGYLLSFNTKQCFYECFQTIESELKKDNNFLNYLSSSTKANNRLVINKFKENFKNFFSNI